MYVDILSDFVYATENNVTLLLRSFVVVVVMNQVAYTDPFHNNIWNSDAGMSSDEETRTSSYLRASSVNSSPNSFPPLIEVSRQDQQ